MEHPSFAEAKWAFIKNYLTTVLELAGGNIAKAAHAARVERSNFKRLMRAHDVPRVPPPWNGLCRANLHGLDHEGQHCARCL